MVQLQKDLPRLKGAGIQIVGISRDSKLTLKKFSEKWKLKYPLVADSESKLINKYDLANKDAREGTRMFGVSRPVTVLIGKDGNVKAKLTKSVRVRHTTDELLKAAKKQTGKASGAAAKATAGAAG